jgi:hypothetical protein
MKGILEKIPTECNESVLKASAECTMRCHIPEGMVDND